MDFPSLRSALSEFFGADADIRSPEDESDAWRAIADSFRHGEYPGLQSEVAQLLRRSDQDILEFLRSCAPAWECDDVAGARRGVEVFRDYVDTYGS
jgi:hypothetical protein